MLSFDQLTAELRQVSYKRGWSFELYEHRWEGPHIAITALLPDSRGGDEITVCIRSAVPPMETRAQFHTWMMWRLGIIELHEMREFYQVRGVVIEDPHADRASEQRFSLE